jgi:hypothetical protein
VEYRWLTILPAITTLTGLGLCYVSFKAWLMLITWSPWIHNTYVGLFLSSAYQPVSNAAYSASIASTILTMSTNIVVTSLITFRLLHACRALAKVLPSANLRVYDGVIAILVESAAPLTISGIIAAVMGPQTSMSPGFYACKSLFSGLFYSFCVSSNNPLADQMQCFLTSLLKRRSLHT